LICARIASLITGKECHELKEIFGFNYEWIKNLISIKWILFNTLQWIIETSITKWKKSCICVFPYFHKK
jgi:hypothetical protein